MINNYKKILIIILILVIIPFSLTGCEDADGLEKLAYVIGIGVDVGEDNILKLTFQFAKLAPTSESGSSQPQESSLMTIDCSSFDEGLALISNYVSKKVSLSHCKIIVFSEEYAINGLSTILDSLTSNLEIRPDANILISKSDAKVFLEESIPSLSNLTARYYQILLRSKTYTGYSDKSPIWSFFINSQNDITEPTAILCGILHESNQEDDKSTNLLNKNIDNKAGEVPLDVQTKVQNMGLAVFFRDKLVGELTGLECIAYLILSNQLDTCNLSIPSPFKSGKTINLKLKLNKKTDNKINLINYTPFIESTVYISGNIDSLEIQENYTNSENIKIIEDYTSSYITSILNKFLYKTTKTYQSDIVGFGEKFKTNYMTANDWENLNWTSLYKESFFKVNVTTKIQSSNLFLKK